jgi:hypothetical protein
MEILGEFEVRSLARYEQFAKSEKFLVRLPGFEPGSSTWQADVLNQARLQPLLWTFRFLNQHF